MNILRSNEALQQWSQHQSLGQKTVGFVPTMGALHEGHLSLVRESLKQCDATVVSIFVNPKQFGPQEDLSSYPRTEQQDLALLETLNVDAVFIPSPEEMYPADFYTVVDVPALSQHLCGASRPGHFRGVATVVTLLFNLVRPDKAFFGEKDFQQLRIIQTMVKDLYMPVVVVGCPTVRESNGLAMSSRNKYLSAQEREDAGMIHQTLVELKQMVEMGQRDVDQLLDVGRLRLEAVPGLKMDYLEIIDYNSLLPVAPVINIQQAVIIAVAVFLGQARLIDHIDVKEF